MCNSANIIDMIFSEIILFIFTWKFASEIENKFCSGLVKVDRRRVLRVVLYAV